MEGLVPIDSLEGDRYMYNDSVRRIVGQRTRREFKIGDRVRVLLDRVNGVEKKLEFSWMDESAETRRPGKKSKKR